MLKHLFRRLLLIPILFLSVIPSYAAKDVWQIAGKSYDVDTVIYKHKAGPGTTFAKYKLASYPLLVSVLEMDLTNPYVAFETCKSGDRGVCEETPISMYERNDAPGHDMIGATNGDFYFYTNVVENGIPRSGQFKKDECITNPVGRACLVLDDSNKPYIDHVDFNGTVTFGSEVTRLHTVNMQRLEWEDTNGNQLNLYTNAYGTETENCSGGTKVIISAVDAPFFWSANKDVKAKIESIIDGNGVTEIPAGKAVLWGRGTSETFLKKLAAGDEITLNLKTDLHSAPGLLKNFKELMGGSDDIILKNGELVDSWGDRHPRTCLGYSKDEKTLYLIVIDGRNVTSLGASLEECAGVFLSLGAWSAVNLDGGGSSLMMVNKEVVNTPSDGVPRAVGNGCLIYSKAPVDDVVSDLAFAPRPYNILCGAKLLPVIYGYNQYGLLKTTDFKDAVLSCDENIGTVKDGVFYASTTSGHGNIIATYGGKEFKQEITLIPCDKNIRLSAVTIDAKHDYNIEIIGTNEAYEDVIEPSLYEWTVADPSICEVKNGVIHALKNGTTMVSCNNKDVAGNVEVTVYTAPKNVMPLVDPMVVSDWKIAKSGAGSDFTAAANGTGIDFTFTGASSRSPYIKMTNSLSMPGIIKSLQLKINESENIVKVVTFSVKDGFGKSLSKLVSLPEDKESLSNVVSLDIEDLFDANDLGIYPISLNSINLTLTGISSSKNYAISIPEMNVIYAENSGAEIIQSDKQETLSVYPNPIFSGEMATVNGLKDSESVYARLYDGAGLLIKAYYLVPTNGSVQLSTTGVAPGMYHIVIDNKTAKLLIK